jgi:hypothetical protein
MKSRLVALYTRYVAVDPIGSESGVLARLILGRPERRARSTRSTAAEMAMALSIIFFILGAMFLLVTARHLPLSFRLLAVSLAGLLTAALVDLVLRLERARRGALERSFWTVLDINHHVRNAMQVIVYHAALQPGTELPLPVREAVHRIDAVLREKLNEGAVSSVMPPPHFVLRTRRDDYPAQELMSVDWNHARTLR